MTRQSAWRLAVVVGAVAALEALCRSGAIDRLTMPPPSRIAVDLWAMLRSGAMAGAMLKTLTNVCRRRRHRQHAQRPRPRHPSAPQDRAGLPHGQGGDGAQGHAAFRRAAP